VALLLDLVHVGVTENFRADFITYCYGHCAGHRQQILERRLPGIEAPGIYPQAVCHWLTRIAEIQYLRLHRKVGLEV